MVSENLGLVDEKTLECSLTWLSFSNCNQDLLQYFTRFGINLNEKQHAVARNYILHSAWVEMSRNSHKSSYQLDWSGWVGLTCHVITFYTPVIIETIKLVYTLILHFIRSLMLAIAILVPLLGLTWVFGLLTVNSNTTVFAWIFTILNSLQVINNYFNSRAMHVSIGFLTQKIKAIGSFKLLKYNFVFFFIINNMFFSPQRVWQFYFSMWLEVNR